MVFFSSGEVVFAVQVNESTGPGGYGWQQVYDDTTISRQTGSADRKYYDYGYKDIQIWARYENYWSADCGWWYVTAGKSLTINISDSDGLLNSTTISTTVASRGATYLTYDWENDLSDPDPGVWTVTVSSATPALTSQFYIYVRGKLNVTSITTTPSSPTKGSTATLNATLKDQAGNLVKGNSPGPPQVTAYVVGPGQAFEVALSDGDNDGYWLNSTAVPAFNNAGDYKVVVSATDGHNYWVDGKGSEKIAVTGSFPYSFAGASSSVVKVVLMILLALLLMRSGRKAAMAVLIFMGGIK
jgi:hypothetical protein